MNGTKRPAILRLAALALAAGQRDGAQWLLPLLYTVPGVVADAGALAGFEPAEDAGPAEFLQALLDHTGAANAWPLTWLAYRADQLAGASVLDRAAGQAGLDEEQQALMALLAASQQPPFTGTTVDLFPNPEVPFAADAVGATLLPMWAEALAGQGSEPQVVPIPNGQGGVTATVQLYAAARAGSPGEALAAEVMSLLLDEQWMGTSVISRTGLSVSAEATDALLDQAFAEEPLTGLAQQYRQAADAVTTARFCALADGALRSAVLGPVAGGEATVAQAAESFAQTYTRYLQE